MFDLPHVASRLYGTPLLVSRPHLESVLSLVENRMFHREPLAFAEERDSRSADLRITSDGIAVIPVIGTLVRRATGMSAACGMPSYHGIAEMAEEAFTSPEVKGVLLEIDSGGGEAAGVFDLAESLRRMSRETEKPLWAVADETALSAAYAIACSAERILLPRTAEVGSIGVFGGSAARA